MLKVNLPIERHPSKKYTRTMFKQFGENLFESGYYTVQEVEPRRRYLTRHINSEAREKWAKVVYEVTVDDDRERPLLAFVATYMHAVLPLPEEFKVMVYLEIHKIPAKHIVKR